MTNSTNTNILICGIGGQGTVLAAKLLDTAALLAGYTVHSAETIGMAQRGGSVISHVRIGENVYSPLIPLGTADMIISFEMAEAVRNIYYLKKDGTVIVNKQIILPSTPQPKENLIEEKTALDFLNKHSSKVVLVDSEKICNELKSSKIVNTILLGAAISCGIKGITKELAKDAILKTVKKDFAELNIKALEKSVGGIK